MPVLLGLFASLLIGISDFLGGRTAGRTTALQTTTAAFLGGTLTAVLYSPALGDLDSGDMLLGAVSGVALAVALTTLWKAYAFSTMGVSAPLASVISTVLPVLYGAARGEVPGVIGWCGVAVGVGALFLTSWQPGRADARRGVALGVVAESPSRACSLSLCRPRTTPGPIVSQRLTAFVLAAGAGLLTRQRPLAGGGGLGWGLVAGAFGASGVAAVVYGGQRGPLAPVVVGGSMYPAVAIGLGFVFLHQRLTRRQVIGLVGALLGVALIALD